MTTTWPDDFRPESPFRPLDWRFRLGRQLANGPLPPHLEPYVDNVIRAVAAFLVGDRVDPAVAAALVLANGPSLDTAEIEGRGIGGQTDAEIADAINLTVEAVSAYLSTFFDVRHLLKHRGALRAIAVGQIDRQAPTPEEAVRWAGFVFDGSLVGVVADYFRRGFADGRRITGTPGMDAEACRTIPSVRRWLGTLGPLRAPDVCLMRWAAVMKKDLHERSLAAASAVVS
jgi:hypothetical protein